jgi:hypothetical protein
MKERVPSTISYKYITQFLLCGNELVNDRVKNMKIIQLSWHVLFFRKQEKDKQEEMKWERKTMVGDES